MTSRSNREVLHEWTEEILSESVRDKRISYNDLSIDEVKSNVSRILIEAYIYISRSRFDSALSQLRQITIYKHDVGDSFLSSTGGRYDSTIPSIKFPIEFWYLVFKSELKARTLTDCINYIRSLEYNERLDLILTIYDIHASTNRYGEGHFASKSLSAKAVGFILKKTRHVSINIKTLKACIKFIKNCSINRIGTMKSKTHGKSFTQLRTSILIPNKFKNKKTLMRANLLLETIIFLCELGRGFDDLPITSYSKILMDKISTYKKTSSSQYRIMLTVIQYENTSLPFYFIDYKSIAIGSDIKMNLKNIHKINESKILRRLEEYKQFFDIKQNYFHEESNLLFSYLYLFRDVNFSNVYKKYSYKSYNEVLPPRTQLPILRLLAKLTRCCSFRRGPKSLEYRRLSTNRFISLQPNMADLFSDIFYILDLIFELSYSGLDGSSNSVFSYLGAILEWSFILILCTIPESRILKNIIIRLTLFGINLAPLDNVESLANLTDYIPSRYKEGFEENMLDVLELDPKLIFAHKLTGNLHRSSDLSYLLFDANSDDSKRFPGFKVRCIEKIMKFILTNVKLGQELDISEYDRLKGLIDVTNLVSLDLFIVLSLIELVAKRFSLSYYYAKLGLNRNEFDINCWRIVYILKWITRQQGHNLTFKLRKKKGHLANGFKIRLKDRELVRIYSVCSEQQASRLDIAGLPTYVLEIKQLRAFSLALRLEEKILAREWWFPWEGRIAKALGSTLNVSQQQESLLIGNFNTINEIRPKRSYEEGICKLLEKLLKDDQEGIENYLWATAQLAPLFYKNEKSYKVYIVLLALCQAGYAKTVIDIVGFSTKENPHMSYLLLYAQACVTDSVYNGRLITRVRDVSSEYPSIHTLTRLEARMYLSVGDFSRANKLFERSEEGYLLGAKREKYNKNFISTIVQDICSSYCLTATDILCRDYSKKCVNASKLC